MSHFVTSTLAVIILTGFSSLQNLRAQQVDIPGVTDVISTTVVLVPDSAVFVKFMIKQPCQDSTYFVQQVSDRKGAVDFRTDLHAYVLTYAVPNTIDSQITGILCNWPEAKGWLGRSVLFSGRYYRAPGVLTRYGGESIFYLYIIALKEVH